MTEWRLPAAIDAIVAALQGLGVQVWDGPIVSGDYDDAIYIGFDGDYGGEELAATTVQTWAGIGQRKRDEDHTITCAVVVLLGNESTSWKPARDKALAEGAPEEVLAAIDPIVADAHLEGDGLGVVATPHGLLHVEHGPRLPNDRDLVRWGPLPALLPLVAWRQRQPAYVTVLVDRQGADITGYRREGPELHREAFTGKVWLKSRPQQFFSPEVRANVSKFLERLRKSPSDLSVAWALSPDGVPKVVAYRVRGASADTLVASQAEARRRRFAWPRSWSQTRT